MVTYKNQRNLNTQTEKKRLCVRLCVRFVVKEFIKDACKELFILVNRIYFVCRLVQRCLENGHLFLFILHFSVLFVIFISLVIQNSGYFPVILQTYESFGSFVSSENQTGFSFKKWTALIFYSSNVKTSFGN